MSRRFVIGVSALNAEADRQFRKYLDEIGAGFWHWIDNFWLINTDNKEISAKTLAKKLNDLGADRNLVLEIEEDISWHGWGRPNKKGKTMFEWLQTTWAEE